MDHTPSAAFTGTTLLAHSQLSSNRSGVSDKEGISRGSLEDRRSFTVDSLQSDWSWQPSNTLLVQFGGSFSQLEGRYSYRDEAEFDLLFDTPDDG